MSSCRSYVPTFEFRSLIVEPDTQMMYRGHAGVRQWFETIVDTFGGFGTEVQGVWDVDDQHAITPGPARARVTVRSARARPLRRPSR